MNEKAKGNCTCARHEAVARSSIVDNRGVSLTPSERHLLAKVRAFGSELHDPENV